MGIVGALVVGDAAVTAGLIGSPMVMVVALTAISSFVVPSIYEPVTIMRFTFILAGGFLGIFGITVASLYFFTSLSAVNLYGVVATAPVSPFQKKDMRDVFTRVGWKRLSRRTWRYKTSQAQKSSSGSHKKYSFKFPIERKGLS